MNNLQKSLFSFTRANPENPSTNLSNPDNWLIDWFGGKTSSGEKVTVDTSLGLPAVWRAAWLLSNTIAALPLQVFEKKDGETNKIDHPISKLFSKKSNNIMTAYIWRQVSMLHVALWGNAYSLIVFDKKMRPAALLPFHPSTVKVSYIDGKLWHKFQTQKGDIVVDSANVLHLKGMSFDGITGKSPISVLRENIGLGLAAQKFGSTFYQKGARLDGVIEIPGKFGDAGVKNLRQTWKDTYEGPEGERLAILDAGMKYHQIGIPPEDSQFIETRKFTITDISRIFGIPPPLLYDLEKATFSNITELILSFTKFDLAPWLENIEQEINDKLFFENEKDTIFAEHNIEGLLRGDSITRSNFYRTMIQNAVMTPAEARRKENENGGIDKFFIPANYMEVTNEKKIKPDAKKILSNGAQVS